ncbi:MAG: hypothetical protein KatS3mg038_3962 [Candidatus Kapaibacterium sp.]|nr:MAG: hypothetical protein KatS3mg038_3962 [Candidatus Kapabacteria bacterium]
MTWTVDLVGSNIIIPTNASGYVDDSTLITSAISAGQAVQHTLSIYAGDPVVEYEIEAKPIASGVIAASKIAIDQYTLALLPYAWDSNDYYDLLRLVGRPYLYITSSPANYPNWKHAAKWYACELIKLDVEHKHETGTKRVTLTVGLTVR